MEIYSEHLHSQTERTREVHLPPPVMGHMSHVTCHVSCVRCQVSHVTCHVSQYYFFCVLDKVVKLVGGGSVINGATTCKTPKILNIYSLSAHFNTEVGVIAIMVYVLCSLMSQLFCNLQFTVRNQAFIISRNIKIYVSSPQHAVCGFALFIRLYEDRTKYDFQKYQKGPFVAVLSWTNNRLPLDILSFAKLKKFCA